ncbi:uncharacterized protein LOC121640472 [Melanotaenia boesemani]|uniref:uncharacterized protein LOC121640472 n=1 Tax=Melanotaenia boesemani TaxID=1250792 RepID=UPI001C03D7EF|nr:uncharacterized protein LOC121640472 [Melanotaenia boesemani]
METLRPPDGLKLVGNVDGNWRSFKQQFELYLAAVGLESKPDARKIALLLTVAGPQVFNTFEFDRPGDKQVYEKVMEKFDAHCSPQKSTVYERYVFRSRVQHPEEAFDVFVTDLRLKAQFCEFGQLKDSMIRDQIVYGVNDKRMRERLLREAKLTLEDAERMCQATELAQQHAKTLNDSSVANENATVAVVKNKTQRHVAQNKNSDDVLYYCRRCGGKHKPRQCPAYGKKCVKCNGKNHFAKQCRSKGKTKSVRLVDEPDLCETFFVGMVSCEDADTHKKENDMHLDNEDSWIVSLPVNGALVALRIDTGAQANLISMTDVYSMKEKPKIFDKRVY